jgi:transposase
MEACATAYYWARELAKLGQRVQLMPAKDVKAYVKRNKNDAASPPYGLASHLYRRLERRRTSLRT